MCESRELAFLAVAPNATSDFHSCIPLPATYHVNRASRQLFIIYLLFSPLLLLLLGREEVIPPVCYGYLYACKNRIKRKYKCMIKEQVSLSRFISLGLCLTTQLFRLDRPQTFCSSYLLFFLFISNHPKHLG